MGTVATLPTDFWEQALERIELLPISIVVAILANSSGFSGAVLFQPIMYFTQGLPLPVSIASGIASETIGMSSGAIRYHLARRVPWPEVRPSLLWVAIGVWIGYIIFREVSNLWLKGILATVLIGVSLLKLAEIFVFRPVSGLSRSDLLWRRGIGLIGGVGSASVGTGVCELHQPYFERVRRLAVIPSNAAAIATEAWGNILISILNLSWGMIDFTVLIWTGPGCFIGAQIGAGIAHLLNERWMKLVFAAGVMCIGIFYMYQVLPKLLGSG
jgi:uncharacterized membrane protein YfcA